MKARPIYEFLMSIPGNFLELMIKEIVRKHLGKEVVMTVSQLRFNKNKSCKSNPISFDRLNSFSLTCVLYKSFIIYLGLSLFLPSY